MCDCFGNMNSCCADCHVGDVLCAKDECSLPWCKVTIYEFVLKICLLILSMNLNVEGVLCVCVCRVDTVCCSLWCGVLVGV